MSRRSAMIASALCVAAVFTALAPVAVAKPSAVIQYSADVPAADGGDPITDADAAAADGAGRLPTVPREVFTRVPERDVYALAQIAISPELGGRGGIAGLTAPPYSGPGQSYPADGANLAEALADSLGQAAFILLLGALVMVGVVTTVTTVRRRAAG
jgi:hypothetical protein